MTKRKKWPEPELEPKTPIYPVTIDGEKEWVLRPGEISDGYHTFDELYDHRNTLYVALCKAVQAKEHVGIVWRSREHSDGTTMPGWFLLGINVEEGGQISYHLPSKFWDKAAFAITFDQAPKFDGHNPADVLERLGRL